MDKHAQPKRTGGDQGAHVTDRDGDVDGAYQFLLNAPFEAIVIHENGVIIEVNDELQRMTGYARDELLGMSALDLFAPQSRAKVLEKISQGVTEPYEAVGLHKSGRHILAQIRGKPAVWNGRPVRVVAARDISDFKAVEAALRDSEQRFHDYARAGSDWFWEMDRNLRFTYISKRFEELTGCSSEGVAGLTRRELASEEQLAKNPEKWARHFADLEAHRPFTNFEYEFKFKGAHGVILSLNGVPIFDADGAFLGYRGTGSDATQRRQVEAALEESERDLRTIIQNMPDIFYRADSEGRLTHLSPAATEILGYAQDELKGMMLSDLYADAAERQDNIERIVAAHGKPVLVEAQLKHKDGHIVVVAAHAFVRLDPDGNVTGVEGIARDVTENKKIEQQILDAKRDAEDASRAKTRFLAAASHDLRQPLQAINLFLAVLNSRIVEEDLREIIKQIGGSVGALNNLLESLLDISRLEAGVVDVEHEVIDSGKVIARLGDEFSQLAREQGLDFTAVPSTAQVRSDPVLLEIVLRNLLGNAINYTHSGKVLFGCRRHAGRVRFEVWDTGVGIPEAQLGQIFEEFYQIGNQARDRHKGLGLGLSIVEKVVKLLGARIEARSVEGKGSMFAITVDGAQASLEIVDQSPPSLAAAAKKIVVIDDEEAILQGLSMFLGSVGHQVEALCCVECPSCQAKIEAMDVPDVIIADYRLRNTQTGVGAVKALRAHFGSHVPAIILTGDTAPERLVEVRDSGLPMLHKPIEGKAFQAEIMRLLEG